MISDERDAIQKKTFTKWVNKHLKKVSSSFSLEGSKESVSFSLRLFSTRVAQSMDVYNIHTYMYIYIYVYVHGLFTILKRTVRLSLRFNDLIRNKDKDRGKKLRNCSGRRREAS